MSAFDDFARASRLLARERVRLYRQDRPRAFFMRVDDGVGGLADVDPGPPAEGIRAHMGKLTVGEREIVRTAAVHRSRFAAVGGESRYSPTATRGWVEVDERGGEHLCCDGEMLDVFVVVVYGRQRIGVWWADYRANGTLGAWTLQDDGGTLASHNDGHVLMTALAPEVVA